MIEKATQDSCNQLMSYWTSEYGRLYEASNDCNMLDPGVQIPPEQMKKNIENYKKWFDGNSSRDEMRERISILKRVAGLWELNVNTINKIIKYMESTLAVIVIAIICGCQSGMYRISTSEDGKKLDDSMKFHRVSAIDFIEDGPASENGKIFDEDSMPIRVAWCFSHTKKDEPGISGFLWCFSLGVFPMFDSEYMTQEVTVKSPLGEKSGTYRIDAKRWTGWIPLFVGYPWLADRRESNARLPNHRLENEAEKRIIEQLVKEFSYEDYVSFAKKKNGERMAEVARIKSVSKKVDELLAMNKFGDAATLIDKESQSCAATRKCDQNSWADMRDRVTVAHQAFDKKHALMLIAEGKYEDAVAFCDKGNSLSDKDNGELKNEAVKTAAKELKDAKRLIAFLTLIKDGAMRDDVVMSLKNLNSLFQLSQDQLVEIANTTERDDVVLAVVGEIIDKEALMSFLDKKRSAIVLKAVMEKLGDADGVFVEI